MANCVQLRNGGEERKLHAEGSVGIFEFCRNTSRDQQQQQQPTASFLNGEDWERQRDCKAWDTWALQTVQCNDIGMSVG